MTKKLNYSFGSGRLARGIVSILLGILLILWPAFAIQYIVIFLGIVFMIIGIVAVIGYLSLRNDHERAIGVPYGGIFSLLFGLLLVIFPEVFVNIIMLLLGIMLILGGINQLVTLSQRRKIVRVPAILYIFAVLVLIAGVVVLFNPFASAASVFVMFGVAAIFYGITELIGNKIA